LLLSKSAFQTPTSAFGSASRQAAAKNAKTTSFLIGFAKYTSESKAQLRTAAGGFVAGGERSVLCRNAPPMGIEFRMAEFSRNSLFEFFGDEVFQPFSFVMQFVYWVIKHAEEKRLDQSMMTDDLKGSLSSSFRQANASVRFIFHERLVGGSQLLQHIGDRSRGNLKPTRKLITADAAFI
jgi:hypothetical protein